MKHIYFLLVFLVTSYISVAFASELTAIAVVEFDARGVPKHEASIIAEKFRSQLVLSGLLKIMDRSQMDEILKEQGFQQSGACSDASCIIEVGQLLSVRKIISGSVGKIGSMYILNVKMIDVETGEIVLAHEEQVRGTIEDVFISAVPKIANKVIQEISIKKIKVGYINITSTPSGASVIIDKKQIGTTPATKIEAKAGERKIVISLKNYTKQHRTIIVQTGKSSNVNFKLSPTETYLSLKKEKSAKKKAGFIKTVQWISASVGIIGLSSAGYFHFDSEKKHKDYNVEKDPVTASDLWNKLSKAEDIRNIMAVAGALGMVGFGFTFVF